MSCSRTRCTAHDALELSPNTHVPYGRNTFSSVLRAFRTGVYCGRKRSRCASVQVMTNQHRKTLATAVVPERRTALDKRRCTITLADPSSTPLLAPTRPFGFSTGDGILAGPAHRPRNANTQAARHRPRAPNPGWSPETLLVNPGGAEIDSQARAHRSVGKLKEHSPLIGSRPARSHMYTPADQQAPRLRNCVQQKKGSHLRFKCLAFSRNLATYRRPPSRPSQPRCPVQLRRLTKQPQ
jgi:hypothetical protein